MNKKGYDRVLTFVHLFDKDCGYDGAYVRGKDFKGVSYGRENNRFKLSQWCYIHLPCLEKADRKSLD